MRRRHLLLWSIPFLVLFGLKTHQTFAMDGDEPHYLLIAESLWADHDLYLENQYPDPHAYLPQETPSHVIKTPNGRLFPLHDIGMGVLLLPVITLIHVVVPRFPASFLTLFKMGSSYKLTVMLCCLQSMVMTGVLAVFLFHYFLSFRMRETTAFYGALACVLTPPILTHGYLIFSELYSAVALIGTLLCWQNRQKWNLWAVGYSLGIFVLSWLHIKNLFLTLILAAIPLELFSKEKSVGWRVQCMPLVSLAAALALRSLMHWVYLGTPNWLAMRDGGAKTVGLAAIPRCFVYNFLDREYGLLFANPLFWLLPISLAFQWVRDRRWFFLEGILIAAYMANILPTELYIGGWHPAARHVLPMVPLVWVPLWSFVSDHMRRASPIRWLVRAWLAGTLVISAYLWQNPKSFWPYGDGSNRWMDAFFGKGPWQEWLPTVFGPRRAMLESSAAWLLGGFVLNVVLFWLLRSSLGSVHGSNQRMAE